MVEPVGVTLASMGLFLQLFDTVDRLWEGFKVTASFGDDWEAVQVELRMQWWRFETVYKIRKIPRSEIDGNREMLKDYLKLMLDYFKICQDLSTWYTGDNTDPFVTKAHVKAEPVKRSDIKPNPIKSFFRRKPKAKPEGSSSASSSTVTCEHLDSETASRTIIAEPGLPGSGPQHTEEALRENARAATNSKPGFYKKTQWARHDYDKFKDMVAKLKAGNENLERLVKRMSPKSRSRGLPTLEEAHRLWSQVDNVRFLLRELHEGLQGINPAPGADVQYYLSVQLLEDHRRSRDLFGRQRGLKKLLRRSSYMFNAQRHCSADLDDSPELLTFECSALPVPTSGIIKFQEMKSLGRPSEEAISTTQGVESWGYVESEGESGDGPHQHAVYHQQGVQWKSPKSLQDILRHGDYHKNISPVQTVQLARLVLSSHLYFEDVQPTSPTSSRPQSYLFYQTTEDEDANNIDWNASNPLVLQPWLSRGFGLQPPPLAFGKNSGIGEAANATMSELGLLLYQIGTGKLLDYGGGGGADLAAPKTHVRNNLSELDRRIGWIYTVIVEGLIDFVASPLYLLTPGSPQTQTEHVKRNLEALLKLEQYLLDAPTATAALSN
ncbi:hypothetical protein LTR66_002327 [Elasticomyces elasticus]|nr:hypothetical protein LTR66_002327 [Elasticomyces elasticus]KAK5011845.1 hypothetical protein LTR28_004362 [Elasticomyces elasticus]